MRTETFIVDGVKITVREPIGADTIDTSFVQRKLTYDRDNDRLVMRAIRFVEYVLRTTAVEGLPWWVDADADADATNAAFEEWQRLPAPLMMVWNNTLWNLRPDFSSPAPTLLNQ